MELLFIVDRRGPVSFDSGHTHRFRLVAGVFVELVLMNIDWHLLCSQLAEVHFSGLSSSQWDPLVLTIIIDIGVADTHRPVIRVNLRLDPIDYNSLLRDH